MTRTASQPAGEQEIDLERGTEAYQRILGSVSETLPTGPARIAGDAAMQQASASQERTRAERSDKGKPRLFLDIPGVRFDLAHEFARGAFKNWLRGELQPVGSSGVILSAFDDLLAHIDRLAARKEK